MKMKMKRKYLVNIVNELKIKDKLNILSKIMKNISKFVNNIY